MRKVKIVVISMVILLTGCFSSSINEKETKTLAEELFEHPEIREIDDCTTDKKYINGIRISLNKNKAQKEKYYREILSQESIEEEDFLYFKERLERTGLRHYFKKDNYSVFVTGGMFGDIEGVLVVHGNDTIPQEGFRLNKHYYIWIGKEFEKDMYWISGS